MQIPRRIRMDQMIPAELAIDPPGSCCYTKIAEKLIQQAEEGGDET